MERNPLALTLERAWRQGISLQSQFFRDNSHHVAMAASQGLISTYLPSGEYSGIWRVTPGGCFDLFNYSEEQNEPNLTLVDSKPPEPIQQIYPNGSVSSISDYLVRLQQDDHPSEF